VRSQRSDGVRTRQAILQTASDLVSVEGLTGLSIGRLGAELGMSKSGVFAHFGSKQELQLATIDAAVAVYRAEIVDPAASQPPGLERVVRLVDAFLSYSRRHVFPGGCFLATTLVEFAAKPGPIRERLASIHEDWLRIISWHLRQAQRADDLISSADCDQIAFEIAALLNTADWVFNLRDSPEALERARRAVIDRLRPLATPSGLHTLSRTTPRPTGKPR
jgi:AcrR family transcriptional regulator